MLTKFKDYEPTGLDSKSGTNSNYIDWGAKDYSDWFIGPSKTRDTTLLQQCNFDCILKELGGEGNNVEILGFGHWALGHYDLIVVRPNTKQAIELEHMAEYLADCPIFDESAYSELEFNTTIENIESELPNDLLTDKDQTTIAGEVYDWIADNDDSEQLESRDDQGGYPDADLIEKACKELGYHSKSEVERNHQEDLLAEIYPDDFLCCGDHHERKHSQDR